MNALAISDLTPMAGEPRVRDVRLGEVLGYTRADFVRRLIAKNEGELLTHGPLCRVGTMVEVGSGARRSVEEYHLNEAQALLTCMFARTDKAAAVRKQVIEVFLAYRRGELAPAPVQVQVQVETPANDPSVMTMNRMEARLEAMEGLGARLERLAEQHRESARALTHLVAIYYDAIQQKRPRFWHDIEVRGLVLAHHRQMTVDQARALITAQCGEKRTPSRSALHRFWQRLDRMRLMVPTQQVH